MNFQENMNLWIFVIKDSDNEFQNRIKNKQWPIYNKTRNRNNIGVGDSVLFYKAGIDGQRFLGRAIIKTNLKKHTMFEYFLELDEISVWKKRILIKPLIPDLDFIENNISPVQTKNPCSAEREEFLAEIKILLSLNTRTKIATPAQKTPAIATVVNFGVFFLHLRETVNPAKPKDESKPFIKPNKEPSPWLS